MNRLPISHLTYITYMIFRNMSAEQAKKAYDRACRLEAEFLEYFTSVVDGSNIEEIYEKVN